MISVGQPLQQRVLSKKLIYSGIIGLILFIMFQVLPSFYTGSSEQDSTAISKAEAREKAVVFATQQLGYTASAKDQWAVVYQSDSSFYGYMSREKLLEDYTKKKLDQRYPYDVFQVSLTSAENKDMNLSVDLNMYTGTVVAFERGSEAADSGKVKGAGVKSVASSESGKPVMSLEQKEELSRPWLKLWGANPSKLQIEPNPQAYGLVYADNSIKVGESRLRYEFSFSEGEVSSYKAGFTAPSWHTSYVEDQTSLATKLTIFGYGIPTLALGILALIYSILRRGHTSFARGIFLSSVHFVIMMQYL